MPSQDTHPPPPRLRGPPPPPPPLPPSLPPPAAIALSQVVRLSWLTRQMPEPPKEARAHAAESKATRMPVLMAAMEHHRKMGLCAVGGKTLEHSTNYARNLNGNLTLVSGNEWLLP